MLLGTGFAVMFSGEEKNDFQEERSFNLGAVYTILPHTEQTRVPKKNKIHGTRLVSLASSMIAGLEYRERDTGGSTRLSYQGGG